MAFCVFVQKTFIWFNTKNILGNLFTSTKINFHVLETHCNFLYYCFERWTNRESLSPPYARSHKDDDA